MNADLPAGGTRAEPGEFHFPGPDGELDIGLIADPAGVPRARRSACGFRPIISRKGMIHALTAPAMRPRTK